MQVSYATHRSLQIAVGHSVREEVSRKRSLITRLKNVDLKNLADGQ